MKYLINNTFNFDDLDGSIKNVTTEETINIPVTAVIILACILKHRGETLQREVLFEDVWEKYGQIPSNNTLTQYISLIRKSFQRLGLTDELIVTVPKVGFYISSEIDVIYETCEEIEKKARRRLLNVKYPVKGMLTVLGLGIFSVAFTALGYYGGVNEANEQALTYIDNNDQCRIQALMSLPPQSYHPREEESTAGKRMHLTSEARREYATENGSSFE